MKFGFLLFLFGTSTLFPFKTNQNPPKPNEWHKSREGDGIIVYTRSQEGTPFKEIKAVVTIESSLNSIVGALTDYDNYKNWVYSTSKSKMVKKINEREFLAYHYIDAPWPVNDRDVVMHIALSQDPKTFKTTVHSTSQHNYLKSVENVVRVKNNVAIWELQPIAKNKVECTYYLKSDPGGNIPAWILNMFISEGPYESIKKLKNTEVQKHSSFKHSDIKERF